MQYIIAALVIGALYKAGKEIYMEFQLENSTKRLFTHMARAKRAHITLSNGEEKKRR